MLFGTSILLVNFRQDNDIRQSIELRDLQPAMDYRVRVSSGNQVDLSPYTQPVHFTTQQEGKIPFLLEAIVVPIQLKA